MKLLKKKKPASQPRPDYPIKYPDGVVVEAGGVSYFIKSGQRFKFTTERVFESWGLRRIPGTEASLANFPVARTVMGFRDGTLVMDFEDNTIYLISGLRRRKITNPDWLDRLNLNVSDATVVSAKEIALHFEGDALD